MTDNPATSLDDLLLKFVHAPDEDVDRALGELYGQGIESIAAGILRRKLRVSLRFEDDGHVNQAGLDLLSDIKAALLPMLQRMRAKPDEDHTGNLEAYVRTAALNAYRQYLRDKYPNRLRLRNKIRYILTTRPEYSIWKDGDVRLCGPAAWETRGRKSANASDIEALREILTRDAGPASGLDDNNKIVQLIDELFKQTTAPLELEATVSIIWDLLGLKEAQLISETEQGFFDLPGKAVNIEERLDLSVSLRRLWDEICTLPVRHRRALLLNLTDGKGDNLIAFLPRLGITSIRGIAAALEYEREDFAKLWAELPLDDHAIAERMGLTRQQVINLRQSARAGLRRRLK
ncbi:MAG: hypothetical protein IPP63_10635 [Chloracidobacterium sp.]|nr:hypothetical protein [Chloracidobacterium sp.]